jgi:N-acylneuraminate cytidylyltransferase
MINGKSVLAIIPARGGSKEVPRKNIREIDGKPLIAWTIEEAKKSKYIDRMILSSDDEEIIRIARKWGCEVPFARPSSIARDDTPGIEPVLHAIETLPEKYDYVVLLQPTSPLRKAIDINECVKTCIVQCSNVCVSITQSTDTPYWMYHIGSDDRIYPIMTGNEKIQRRQDSPPVYVLNGAVYVAKTKWLLKNRSFITEETIGYIMPFDRSVDVDTELDIDIVSYLLQTRKN